MIHAIFFAKYHMDQANSEPAIASSLFTYIPLKALHHLPHMLHSMPPMPGVVLQA